MAEDKIFVGNGKQVFENLVSVSLCLSDIPQEHIFEYNGKKYIKLNVGAKKGGKDQYGKTHHVSIDTYNPEAKSYGLQSEPKPEPKQELPAKVDDDDDELPF